MKLITPALIDAMVARASASPRLRINHNVHEVPEDPVQRLFVTAKRDSYFRAHRHPTKWEFSLVVQGLFDVFTFDEVGTVTQRIRVGVGGDTLAFELPANVFHTWLPLADDGLFFEVKPGPYDPQTAAEFAPWAPAESAAGTADFVAKLTTAKVGDVLA